MGGKRSMDDTRQLLRLVDDPVARIVWMLRSMPLESAVACLEQAARRADQLGLLSPEDRGRIVRLLSRVPAARLDEAA
jgi:hypothetical protein